jgi:hypothetical protein
LFAHRWDHWPFRLSPSLPNDFYPILPTFLHNLLLFFIHRLNHFFSSKANVSIYLGCPSAVRIKGPN